MRIYSRTEWGARYRDGVGNREVSRLDKIAHHTVTAHLPENATFDAECAQMRNIEAVGQARFGGGISYTFVIFPSGRVYQGVSIHRISYHTGQGHNSTGVAICLAGNYENYPVTEAQRNSIAELLQYGVAKGWWAVPAIEILHRDIKATACPGRHYVGAVADINARAGGTPKAPRPVAQLMPSQELRSDYPSTAGIAPELDVATVQRQLRDCGYYPFEVDGDCGPKTLTAIYSYQMSQQYFPGLLRDGYWGHHTQAHYEWVKALQSALNGWRAVMRLGYVAVDGDYGHYTSRCVHAVIAANLNGAYREAVELAYGKGSKPVNDGVPGPAFCRMVGISEH